MGAEDDPSPFVLKYCPSHWKELPEEKRQDFERQQREIRRGAWFDLLAKVPWVLLIGYLVWTWWDWLS